MSSNIWRSIKSLATGLLAGFIAALVMTFVMLVLRYLLGLATPAELFGDRIAPTFNPGEFLQLLQQFGGYNELKQAGAGSVLAGQIVVGTLGGLIYASLAGRGRRGFIFACVFVGLFWIVSLIVLWPVLETSYLGLPPAWATITNATGLLLSYVSYGAALLFAYRFMTSNEPIKERAITAGPPIKRRVFIASTAGVAVAAATFGLLYKLFQIATFSYDGKQYIGPEVQPITPTEDFYTVTKNVIDPEVARSVWRLEVTGMVEQPRDYSYADLRALPVTTQETTLMCISNWVGGGLMSNAVWRGVPLRSLIEAASPRAGVVEVMFRAVDGYTDTIPYEKAMEESTFVAYEMNEAPLTQTHGFPARIVVPGMYGEKSVKWVTRIELVDHDAKGFYEQQGWGPDFVVPTRSRFDFPYYDQEIKFQPAITLKGIAFGGDRGVSRVEVSTDGGRAWNEARIDYPGSRLTWALWSYDWRPASAGEYKLVVRATDGTGAPQIAEDRSTVPQGATGYHRVTVRLET
ncbi:MAG TPA: molybdopterin-dependent oxidoreductase [Blastocatellia bacterium]|nr:molybdopterin-dependent oxidoreductase [Blastocatellia bacterium]